MLSISYWKLKLEKKLPTEGWHFVISVLNDALTLPTVKMMKTVHQLERNPSFLNHRLVEPP